MTDKAGMKINEKDLASFQKYLVQCKNIVILIGSGLSSSSGIETFQNTSEYWHGHHLIDLSTPDAFLDNPGLVWQFYSWRRHNALRASPNKGHFALAELSRRINDNRFKKCLTISQNVDGLNLRAGHDAEHLMELHGDLFTLKCTDFFCNYVETNNFKDPLTQALKCTDNFSEYREKKNCKRAANDKDDPGSTKRLRVESPEIELELTVDDLPKCPKCGGLLRPGVVWFGESISLKTIDKIDDFLLKNKVDLILVIGTSGKVWPAVSYVERVKIRGGKIAVFNKEINFDEIEKDMGNIWGFEGDAAVTLEMALEPIIGKKYLPRNYRRM